jgi:drug/metabolite transporter (DMT)-like permease
VAGQSKNSSSWVGLWIALSVTWGFSFLFIKVAGQFLDPFQTTFARLTLGALALTIYMAATRRRPVTKWAAVKHLAFCGLIAQAMPFTLFAWAEHHISSVAAGLVNSTMSLWTGVLAIAILPEERLNRLRGMGLILGFVGVVVLLGVWDATFRGDWFAYVACAISTMGYSISALWTRKFLAPMKLDPYGAVVTQLFFAASAAGIVSLANSSRPTHWPLTGIASIVLLGAFGTGIALVLNFLLIQRAGAMATSTVTYSIPIVSTLAGAIVLRESIHWYEPVGAIIILIGIAIVQGLLPRQRSTLVVPATSD